MAEQILNFHYSDGANMLTVAWVIFDEGQRPLFELCNFSALEFVRSGVEAFRIDIPKITAPEVRSLARQLPLPNGKTIERGSIPEGDANQYLKLYRYFPSVAFIDG
jgi:hypothetical protein